MIESAIGFFTALPPWGKIVVGVFVIGIVLAILKRFIKFAIYLALLTILIIVIFKLLA